MKSCKTLIAIAAIFTVTFAYAQEERATTKKHLEKLQPFIGEWVTELPAAQTTYYLKYSWLYDKTGITFEWDRKMQGGERLPVGRALIGWNGETKEIVSRGIFPPGSLFTDILKPNGQRWVINRDTTNTDGSHRTREIVLQFVDDTTMTTQYVKMDDQPVSQDALTWKQKQ